MNELKHLDQFNTILKNYKVSDQAVQILKDTKFVACDAASAAGRNTIIRELVKTNKYYYIVSDTTRKPRVNDGKLEQNGEVYWFRKEQDMLADLKAGKYIEAEVIHQQQVSGVSVREIAKAKQLNRIAITDMDRVGVSNTRAINPDIISLFFLPPDFDSWQKRLFARGSMSQVEYARRMNTAKLEYQNALANSYYYYVVNDDLAEAIGKVQEIVNGDIDEEYQADAKAKAKRILKNIEKMS